LTPHCCSSEEKKLEASYDVLTDSAKVSIEAPTLLPPPPSSSENPGDIDGSDSSIDKGEGGLGTNTNLADTCTGKYIVEDVYEVLGKGDLV
jgi:hypothetical protein